MYSVVGTPRSRAMRVIWLLEELGQPYEIRAVAPQSDAIRDVYAAGKVPALITPEGVLTDSVAIMTFLADKHGDPETGPTFPAGGFERARQDGHTQFIVDELDGALWTLSKHTRILPETRRASNVEPACLAEYATGIERLAERLGAGPYLMGERFTVPDILAGHVAGWAKSYKIELKNDVVAAYLKRIYGRPSNQRARERAAAALQG